MSLSTADPDPRKPQGTWDRFGTWVAEGFGVGWIPLAPGTFGSILGIAWAALLLLPRSPWLFGVGLFGGFLASVYFCGLGERTLGKSDPGSIVLDEITAVPVCFVGWLAWETRRTGSWPGAEDLFSGKNWVLVLAVFVVFRFFDIAKPWPVKGSQKLPGGWGVTVDDFLAAAYVNLLTPAWYLLLKS